MTDARINHEDDVCDHPDNFIPYKGKNDDHNEAS